MNILTENVGQTGASVYLDDERYDAEEMGRVLNFDQIEFDLAKAIDAIRSYDVDLAFKQTAVAFLRMSLYVNNTQYK